jgi:hypothetical protein
MEYSNLLRLQSLNRFYGIECYQPCLLAGLQKPMKLLPGSSSVRPNRRERRHFWTIPTSKRTALSEVPVSGSQSRPDGGVQDVLGGVIHIESL